MTRWDAFVRMAASLNLGMCAAGALGYVQLPVNCKHFIPADDDRRTLMLCAALRGKQHPLLGNDISTMLADMMRLTLCGWNDPKLWEPK